MQHCNLFIFTCVKLQILPFLIRYQIYVFPLHFCSLCFPTGQIYCISNFGKFKFSPVYCKTFHCLEYYLKQKLGNTFPTQIFKNQKNWFLGRLTAPDPENTLSSPSSIHEWGDPTPRYCFLILTQPQVALPSRIYACTELKNTQIYCVGAQTMSLVGLLGHVFVYSVKKMGSSVEIRGLEKSEIA